ncbi:MAG: twin-arginine translocase TatA/TatE family subunit [Alphaproteobacteria bacterium]|jgi:sec-independent protein translocase protein TatA|nr:twin-arginine translocase TatA/TatE family subunit [Alphaproteobacteria bacterium]PHY00372.1 MAG: twin-arginine translocase TatA/TatE family subunit [Rhodospirillaceae bacterium]
MGSFSIWHWVIVLVVVLLLFGAGKIPRLMGDVAKGINAFKKGLKEEVSGDDAQANAKSIDAAKEKDATTTS